MTVKNPELLPLFDELKELLSLFAESFSVRRDEPGRTELYVETDAVRFFGAQLLATLKGKSCFYIKKLTPEIRAQIVEALSKGLELYRQRGWV